MDNKNEDDQIIQDLERKLKLQQESIASKDTQVEKSWRNPYNGEKRFSLISPMYDMVLNQMNVINTCFSVHSHIAFTKEDEKNSLITKIPQLLADILFEGSNIRNNLIEIIGAMEQLSNGIARFVKIAKNPKFKDKPLVKFLHFVETPRERLEALLDKTCELDTQKVSKLEECLVCFMKYSGSKTIPDWIKLADQCKKELENLENKRQRKFIDDIKEYDEVAKVISEIEFYQTQLAGHEHLKKDLQAEKKMLQANRDFLENQAIGSATSSNIVKIFLFMRNNDIDVLRKQKKIIKQEISEIMDQESHKIQYEAECKKVLASLSIKSKSAKEKVEKAKINKEQELTKIDDQIKKKKEEVKKYEDQILNVLEKYGNPSIKSTCLMLESIAKLARQHQQGTDVTALNKTAMKTFLEDIKNEIGFIHETGELSDDEWIETSIAPLNFFILEIRPIIRNSIYGTSPKELTEYSAGKALEPAYTV